MAQKIVRVGDIQIGNDLPFVLFGGMNVLESRDLAMQVCEEYVRVTEKLGIPMCSRPASTRPTVPRSTRSVVRAWKRE
ncbi:2-dehydro-3-deoxyphosphooctonate aldolase [Pseudomonas aeruginosa]|nr:2-dehydro-3-deoxyphosphooctonate aldolase [Pseudomonas aeruginosa]